MSVPLRVLLVEDSADDAELLRRSLERAGYALTLLRVEDEAGMTEALAQGAWGLVIADHSLPRFGSEAAIAALRAVDPDVGCIIVSGNLGEEAAVAAMRSGADDYVLKDRLQGLPGAVERTLRTAEARRDRRRVEARYRSLVDNAPNGVISMDAQGRLSSVNPAFAHLTGLSEGEAIGRPFVSLIHPDDAARIGEELKAAFAAARPSLHAALVAAAGGLYFHADITLARLVEGTRVTGLFGIVRDTTEQRAMERDLRRNEAHLRTLVDAAPDGIYTLAPTGEVLSINPALTELLGLDFTLVGRRFREVVYPEDLPLAADSFARRLQGEHIPPYELRLMRVDGSPVPVEITSSQLREEGKLVGTLGIVRDIRRRKATEKELALREERFRLVTQATQDAVYDWDVRADTTWWNERAAVLFGEVPAPQEPGLEWWAIRIHPEDRERVVQSLQRAAKERQALWTEEYRFRHAGGGWRVLMDMGLYLYDEQGTATRMIGAMSDITERREGELEQARLQAAIRGAATDWTVTFDAVPMPVLLLDEAEGIRRVNRAAREAAGIGWDAMIRSSLADLPGAPWELARPYVTRALATDRAQSDMVEHPSGRSWNIVVAPVATSSGRHVVLLIRDVTDTVQMQRTLGHQRTMAALGALVAGVAHEVRNPLFAISATLDAFEARFGREPDVEKYTANLRPEVQRLSALMRDLLEYGRPAELHPVERDILPVVREAVGRSEGAAGQRGIRIEVRAAGSPGVVRHDPGRMQQVVQNLLDNALVHAPAESVISVTIATRDAGGTRWCAIAIEDQGPGFRAEDLAHVFEPFFSKRRGGTGLGLSIVERLVGQHGGQVVAANRPAGGASVTILLPLT